jgi:beta-aspartyl-dipeptidase (metallo-type)
VSSDGGGCLPVFNEQGEVTEMDIGSPALLAKTLQALLEQDVPLDRVLPAFTSNVARALRLHDKGRIAVGSAADILVLSEKHEISDVMAAGAWHIRDGEQQIFGKFEQT